MVRFLLIFYAVGTPYLPFLNKHNRLSVGTFSLTMLCILALYVCNHVSRDNKNYLQNFIYSFLFLLNGMPDIGYIGADLLRSGKG